MKAIILDTSILCVWLQVPKKETCGKGEVIYDYNKVKTEIEKALSENSILVLPLAAIIETGNHISQCPGDKHHIATKFENWINDTVNGLSPWAAFSKQSILWEGENLKMVAKRWRENINSDHSYGDASIVDVANFYNKMPIIHEVVIFTGDEGLKSYEPKKKQSIIQPRRNQK
ncbi:hypothetical protein BN938_2127 [Mucinivorans hirudinis]|uniref:PIN domain-containing protein n=1 Tax=Mucinivorans hirudinis TaxID=1433126 RepID=A0A060R9B7_9BACT|nr:hypothetical protein BN938_2127 [Mucinivorans hirudinis]